MSMTKVKSLVCDGCEKTVGWWSGVHATLEFMFLVPFQQIQGGGRKVNEDVHKLALAAFEVLPNPALLSLIDDIPEDVFKDLSTYHQIFIRE